MFENNDGDRGGGGGRSVPSVEVSRIPMEKDVKVDSEDEILEEEEEDSIEESSSDYYDSIDSILEEEMIMEGIMWLYMMW